MENEEYDIYGEFSPIELPPHRFVVFEAPDGEMGIRAVPVTQKEYNTILDGLTKGILTKTLNGKTVHLVVGNSACHDNEEPCYICEALKKNV